MWSPPGSRSRSTGADALEVWPTKKKPDPPEIWPMSPAGKVRERRRAARLESVSENQKAVNQATQADDTPEQIQVRLEKRKKLLEKGVEA